MRGPIVGRWGCALVALALAGCGPKRGGGDATRLEGEVATATATPAPDGRAATSGREAAATSAPEGRAAADRAGAPEGRAFGLEKETAVRVCKPPGERAYLSDLRCPDGAPPSFDRAGSVGSRDDDADVSDFTFWMDASRVLPPGMKDGHVVDLYNVACSDGTAVDVYMDMYHCSDPDPLRAVGKLRPSAPPSEARDR